LNTTTVAAFSKRTFHYAFSLRTSPRQLDSLARVSRAARPFTLATRTSPIRTSTFQLDSRPRDRTPRIASRADLNARATPRTRPACLSALAEAASAAVITTSPRALVLAAPTTTTRVVSSSILPCLQCDRLPRTRRRCANATAPACSGLLSNSSSASGFGSTNTGGFGSTNNNTGGGLFGGGGNNTTSTFGSGGT
jgi:uncharacterized membrane protein YgcG